MYILTHIYIRIEDICYMNYMMSPYMFELYMAIYIWPYIGFETQVGAPRPACFRTRSTSSSSSEVTTPILAHIQASPIEIGPVYSIPIGPIGPIVVI